jgi:hypothetical protein
MTALYSALITCAVVYMIGTAFLISMIRDSPSSRRLDAWDARDGIPRVGWWTAYFRQLTYRYYRTGRSFFRKDPT